MFAIKAENLGKSYLIGHQKKEPYSTLRDSLAHGVRNVWNRVIHPNLASSGSEIEEFWALKDVSFEIQPGDRVGIIGRNGAGKSTLLKILSRITEPTTGRFVTRGRVASLLEVGTGFHPELTGRENIYLNGAILGMTRADVKRQFDAIVDFSGVEKFLDTPVKRYSSGMYVRLAFSVAAHLEPDILIVDEVLAVGDAEFQKKCLGKMEEVGKEGRTVVFVSHNMGAVRRLCDRGIYLVNGILSCYSTTDNTLDKYTKDSVNSRQNDHRAKQQKGIIHIRNAIYVNKHDQQTNSFLIGELSKIIIQFDVESTSTKFISKSNIDIGINSSDGSRVAWLSTSIFLDNIGQKNNEVTFLLNNFLLNVGMYSINVYCETDNMVSDWIKEAFPFEIQQNDYYNSGRPTPQINAPYITDYKLTFQTLL